MKSFKQYTAKKLLELLKRENATTILEHLQYSSARDYEDVKGLIDVERFW